MSTQNLSLGGRNFQGRLGWVERDKVNVGDIGNHRMLLQFLVIPARMVGSVVSSSALFSRHGRNNHQLAYSDEVDQFALCAVGSRPLEVRTQMHQVAQGLLQVSPVSQDPYFLPHEPLDSFLRFLDATGLA